MFIIQACSDPRAVLNIQPKIMFESQKRPWRYWVTCMYALLLNVVERGHMPRTEAYAQCNTDGE